MSHFGTFDTIHLSLIIFLSLRPSFLFPLYLSSNSFFGLALCFLLLFLFPLSLPFIFLISFLSNPFLALLFAYSSHFQFISSSFIIFYTLLSLFLVFLFLFLFHSLYLSLSLFFSTDKCICKDRKIHQNPLFWLRYISQKVLLCRQTGNPLHWYLMY